MVGVEVGGATKNVLAIGAGISDGLGFGANTRVALITRGLAEMMRLGVALGADKDTFMGLAGPRRPRAHLHRRPVAQPALRPAACGGQDRRRRRRREIGQVVEGVLAARAVHDVAQRHRRRDADQRSRSTACSTKARRRAKTPCAALMGRTVKRPRRSRRSAGSALLQRPACGPPSTSTQRQPSWRHAS
ncbi:MAG: hypothetical protein MZV64_20915 [Ignavibacteriales bacterium]|nr:hypothetical protein [Ignavibacteriales bacterium]